MDPAVLAKSKSELSPDLDPTVKKQIRICQKYLDPDRKRYPCILGYTVNT